MPDRSIRHRGGEGNSPATPERSHIPKQPLSSQEEHHWLGRWFAGIRRDGFLALLEPQDWHTLSAILSFTSGDGARQFTLEQLGSAIAQPRDEAGRRLGTLAQRAWKDRPLLTIEHDPTGAVCGATLAAIERLAVPDVPSEDEPALDRVAFTDTLMRRLADVGLNSAQIDRLANRFSEADVERQLDWLPARGARNPAALLIRAVEQQWEKPKELA